MELGPCTVNDKPKSANDTTANPYSWNQNANVFFLDEPLGVGFSQGEHGQAVKTTEEAAMDVQAFVQIVCPACELDRKELMVSSSISSRSMKEGTSTWLASRTV